MTGKKERVISFNLVCSWYVLVELCKESPFDTRFFSKSRSQKDIRGETKRICSPEGNFFFKSEIGREA